MGACSGVEGRFLAGLAYKYCFNVAIFFVSDGNYSGVLLVLMDM